MTAALGLPPHLQKYAGRILDVDSHEMMPAQRWVDAFGPEIRPLVEAWTGKGEGEESHANHPNVPDYEGDLVTIDANIVNVKGCRSPGAVDSARRLEVMDSMGIAKQLMFPGHAGLNGLQLIVSKDEVDFLRTITGDRAAVGKRFIELYNDWAIDLGRSTDRLLPVVPLYGDTVDEMIAAAQTLIKRGIKAIWLAAPIPPGGKSPAHPDLDPFWALMAEADCTVTLHLGSAGSEGERLFASPAWGDAPPFKGHLAMSEFKFDPWSLSTVHLPCQNFLATMIIGGVFVRHPRLRFGVIEVGAYWVGPMAETLDLWHKNLGQFNKNVHRLPELPSTYLSSNVRISGFPFEEIDVYLERHPYLADVLCFATDYPHIEGGKDIFNVTSAKLEKFGEEALYKYFVGNAEWIMPH
ncbi:amidohydrolase family protein [Sphingosinicella rhizophila]|uniref:Amidohydrolase family protein n=1 Tax=Sphingosinicella rhizophila TaxID=3050082 RepID=A0ABU3QAZ3_9SPHN|nr:amidohydrolase family protein [Sphingosinicella sp. GR2756]MDT9600541.1 amidohydrolase family protein [Sphingosinicella sp. GR2756]